MSHWCHFPLVPLLATAADSRHLRHVMRAAALMVRSARRSGLRFAKTNSRLDWLHGAMISLEAGVAGSDFSPGPEQSQLNLVNRN